LTEFSGRYYREFLCIHYFRLSAFQTLVWNDILLLIKCSNFINKEWSILRA
jgi:hypothetical protein